MALTTLLFPRRRILIVALLLFAYVFGSPIFILFSFKQAANPQLQRNDGANKLPSGAQQHFNQVAAELRQIGFQLEDSFLLPQAMDNVRAVLQLYVSRAEDDAAIVVTAAAKLEGTWTVRNQYCEFTTHYRDGSDFNTNNSTELNAFKSPKHTITTPIPWIRDTKRLYEAHTKVLNSEATNQEKVLQLDSEFAGDTSKYLQAEMRHELENAVADGYLKISDNQQDFVPTLYGAYVMTWSQMRPFKWLVARQAHRTTRQRLARAGFE